MDIEDTLKEIKYLVRETFLMRKILLLNKWPTIERWFQRSPAFSDIKYAPIRENIPMVRAGELNKLTKEGAMIYVFSFPKSGNVWLMNLIKDALGLEKDIVSFTHGGFSGSHYYNKNIFRGACLMRDIRDVIVSFYHFSSTKGGRNDTCVFNDIESFYYDYFISYTKHFGSLEQYTERLTAWGIPLIKYERLWDNPVGELERLFARWRIIVSREEIEKSVEKNSIEKYKTGETNVLQEHIHSSHFRSGGYGGYIDEIPPSVLSDINKRFGEYLCRWGYKSDG